MNSYFIAHRSFFSQVQSTIAVALLAGLLLGPAQLLANEASVGLVPTKPEKGPFVETDQGFMVPYTASIPGTDATFEMIPIPGGKFSMGSPADEPERNDDEGPQREITLQPFWMAKCEVTWSEYRPYMTMYDVFKDFESEGIRQVNDGNKVDAITAPTPLYDPSFTFLLGEEPKMPAVTMSHYSARQYSKWLSNMSKVFYRLPTEAEWEYACRAGTKTAYSFGDDTDSLDDYAWYYDNSDDMYHDVGQKKPNAFGLHDMHGNVSEIVLDQYHEDAYQKKATTSDKAVVWTEKMFPHAIRGGSWADDPPALRSAARAQTENWREEDPNLPKSPWWFTDEPSLNVGFRLVRPLVAPATAEQRARYWEIDNEELRQAVEDRLAEGRGVQGVVDGELPALVKEKTR